MEVTRSKDRTDAQGPAAWLRRRSSKSFLLLSAVGQLLSRFPEFLPWPIVLERERYAERPSAGGYLCQPSATTAEIVTCALPVECCTFSTACFQCFVNGGTPLSGLLTFFVPSSQKEGVSLRDNRRPAARII